MQKEFCDGPIKLYFKFRSLQTFHNSYGPAFITRNGYKSYWVHGEKHNDLGPSILHTDGKKYYHLKNKNYSYNTWLKQINKKEK